MDAKNTNTVQVQAPVPRNPVLKASLAMSQALSNLQFKVKDNMKKRKYPHGCPKLQRVFQIPYWDSTIRSYNSIIILSPPKKITPPEWNPLTCKCNLIKHKRKCYCNVS